MKILDVNEFYAERGGGVRTYVHRKLEAAATEGVQVVVVAPGERDGEEVRRGGKIVWVRSPKLVLDPRYHVLLRERAVHEVIRAESPDLIEGSSTWTAGWMAARYPRPIPRVLVFHQDPVAVYPQTLLDRFVAREAIDRRCEPYWRYLRRLASRFDRTVVSGDWLAERLRVFDVPRPVAVPFGIDKERFRPERRSAAKRAELLLRCGLDANGKLLVAV
ncbi:MAG: glycosyltransferase, partial [Polyangiaceae bacterium]|nr:glycosyltransferase [Polyangiaceae bacterium]